MDKLISVIIPVYNVEEFLPECIKSVIDQTYKNIEILLIDDGATDSSGAICDKFAETDNRIKVIHKENSGVSDARNLGIEKSNGEYFCFIDGDDNVSPDYIETMASLHDNYSADFTMISYVFKWRNGKTKITRNGEFPEDAIFIDSGHDALKKMLYSKIYAPSSNGKLFDKSKCNVHYPDFTIGEDAIAAVDYFKNAEKVVMMNKRCYNYMQNENSVMHAFNPKKLFDMVISADEIYKKCENISPEVKKAAAYYLVEKNLITLMKLYGHDDCRDKIKLIAKNIKKHRKTVILDKNAAKRKKIDCIISYLGINTLCKIKTHFPDGNMGIIEIAASVFNKLTEKLPRKNIIIFEARPIFSDNTYWFYKYLAENDEISKKYKFVWVVTEKNEFKKELCGRNITCIIKNAADFTEKLRYFYYTHFAKFLIDCNDYVRKTNFQQKRIYLGHGMPVKIAAQYLSEQGETDLNTFTSTFFYDMYRGIGFKDSEMCNFGYCRNDILAENFGKRKNNDVTNIIWMPTYRQHSSVSGMAIKNKFPLGLPVLKSKQDIAEINECLKKNNAVLYLRPHPAQDISVLHIDEMSNIIIADNAYLEKRNIQLYEFLTETDALITDYSSVYYDYLLLGRPIALMIEDIEEFQTKWKLFFDDYKANMVCPYLDTVDDFKKFIEDTSSGNDEYYFERIKARDRFNDYHDAKNRERLYNFMVKEYNL